MRKHLFAAAVLSLFAVTKPSFAVDADGKVARIFGSNGLGEGMPLTFVEISGVTTTSCGSRYATTNKNIIAQLLAAFMAGRTVHVAGTGACYPQWNDGSSEGISYIVVNSF